MMHKAKKAALEAAGFKVGNYEDFLGLSKAEQELVELRLSISRMVRKRREKLSLTQKEAAKRIGTTQPRFAKIEAGDSDVSLDQMMKGLFAVGGSLLDLISRTNRGRRHRPAKVATGA